MENEFLQKTIESIINEYGFNAVAECYTKCLNEFKERHPEVKIIKSK